MSEEYDKNNLSNVILVRNIPPDSTVDQITKCFSAYGNVMACSICALSYMNVYYSFRMCYVRFDCNDPIIDLLENDIDVILGDYYLNIESAVDSKLVWDSIVILGIGVGTKKEQVEESLEQFNSPQIIKFQEASVSDNGYCIAQFSSPSYVNACLEYQPNINIYQIPCAIRPFPPPIFHYVRISPTPIAFQSLRGVEQFNDFTFITPEKSYKCSSMVAAFSCSVVRNLIENGGPLEFNINIKGDFQIVIDAIYGSHVRITKSICNYIYRVASLIGYKDLRRIASLVCYELLTPENVVSNYINLADDGFQCDYIIEFIATHIKDIPYIQILPASVLKTVLKHPLFKSITPEESKELVEKVPALGPMFNENGTCIGSIEDDRAYIIQKLENLEEMMTKAEIVHQNMQNAALKPNGNTESQESVSFGQMHNDDREQMRRNFLVVDEVSASDSSTDMNSNDDDDDDDLMLDF